MATGKKYGLIIPSKKKPNIPTKAIKPSVFAEDSSSDDDELRSRGKYGGSIWKENKRNAERMETHGSVVKALAEDPSVFEYDSLYDKIQDNKRKADPRLKKKDTQPKYIGQLKKMAEKRKLEQEITYERKVQQEIENEGLESENNEAFLTSAYRKKLEERKQMVEELKREEEIDAANDVTKQKDITRFQKHLFNQITSGPSVAQDTKGDKEKRKKTDGTNTHDEQANKSNSELEGPSSPNQNSLSSEDKSHDDVPETNTQHSDYNTETTTTQGDSVTDTQHPCDNPETTQRDSEDNSATLSPSAENILSPSTSQNSVSEIVHVEVNKEERRKIASAKRTDEEAQMSARERYLARKKARLTVKS